MYFYSVSTGCYSDYEEIMLVHTSKFSSEEFEELIINACINLKEIDDYIGYANDVVDYLIKNNDFKKLSYINCHAFDYSCDDCTPITKRIPEEE